AVLAVIFGLEPHMPPGADTAQAHEQRIANTVIAALLAPITVGVLVYFVFALTTFRQRGDVIVDGPPIYGHSRIQATWAIGTVAVVLVLAAYGTYALFTTDSNAAGAGGGQGPKLS